ncbi:FAD-dependent oxidoreductase [Salinirarus marinus]|uniref:FAD-dependent oxidoreductase n=1 Tax=Salinirarus marinus TaxID=3068310 RepID=UPI003C6C9663
MVRSTDVLVIGGGATGVGVARDLALRGVDVTLVERSGLAGGTTGRSHGLLHSGARYAETDPEGATECLAENRILRSIAGACVRETGGYFVQLDADDPDYFDEKRAACRDLGIDVETVGSDALREAVPGVTDRAERAMHVPDGVIYPSRLVAATAADAREHGATIHTYAPVEDLHVGGGRVTGATVGGDAAGRFEATAVVNAAGAWAESCAELAGVDVPMRPTRGVMVAVDYPDLEPVLNRCRPPADGDIVVPHDREAVLGTTSVAVDDPDDDPREEWEVERVREECAAMLPAVADAPVGRTYWGVRPLYDPDEAARDGRGVSRDFFLLDHAADGVDGFVSVVGGKLTTHRAMAEATADLVCRRLGTDAPCRTATEPLTAAADPDRLAELVAEFDACAPADGVSE